MSREQEFFIPLVAAVAMFVDKNFYLDKKKFWLNLLPVGYFIQIRTTFTNKPS